MHTADVLRGKIAFARSAKSIFSLQSGSELKPHQWFVNFHWFQSAALKSTSVMQHEYWMWTKLPVRVLNHSCINAVVLKLLCVYHRWYSQRLPDDWSILPKIKTMEIYGNVVIVANNSQKIWRICRDKSWTHPMYTQDTLIHTVNFSISAHVRLFRVISLVPFGKVVLVCSGLCFMVWEPLY